MSKLVPKYSLWEAINAALQIGMRALEEIRTLARLPGPAGKDGRDGVSYDDFDEEEEDDGRFLVRTYRLNGEVVKTKRFLQSRMIYREVYKEGITYLRGDTVSYGGSLWHCNEPTSDKPDQHGTSKKWTLAAKRGRDGKDGILKDPPKGGPVKVG